MGLAAVILGAVLRPMIGGVVAALIAVLGAALGTVFFAGLTVTEVSRGGNGA